MFTSDVSQVLLPVFVVDSEGRAVRGLETGDFELHQDRRKAEIASFRYVDTAAADDQDELAAAADWCVLHAVRRSRAGSLAIGTSTLVSTILIDEVGSDGVPLSLYAG